jgi:hypothetical protein
VSSNKLLLGVPYYGYQWKTSASSIPSSTLANGSALYYNTVKNNYWNTYTREKDEHSNSPYYVFQSGGSWYQCWADDEISLTETYEMVKQKDIAGIGIWALGYDDGYDELWNLISDEFSDCATTSCSDTLFDSGGPYGDYYDDENYFFTIAPDNASMVSVDFIFFDLENNYDYLYVYDGYDTNSTLLGSFTGSSLPTKITSSSSALTLKFISDGATTNAGWGIIYNCLDDTIAPTTSFSVNAWYRDDFYLQFQDDDNNGGSGIDEQFYLVVDYDGSLWSTNTGNGFFNDYCDTLGSEWISSVGIWNVNSGAIQQSDESQSNTNIYAPLEQSSSNSYLYSWEALMSGSGNNKRSGIHFFCDDASQSERGNSYFVYFREDDDLAQIYKVVNNSYTLEKSIDCSIDKNVWYNYKVSFDPVSGVINLYKDDELVVSWTDASPHQIGNYISLRTGNANVLFDDLRTYKSRKKIVKIKVGNGNNQDIRYQNTSETKNSAVVASLVSDSAHNWSLVGEEKINVDWSAPSDITIVNDGLNSDKDSCDGYGTISANWNSSNDSNSGIVNYWYAIGSSPGLTDVLDWTSNGNLIDFSTNTVPMLNNAIYYVGVKVENNAGLFSDSLFSDGQLNVFGTYTQIENVNDRNFKMSLYPNPANKFILINISGINKGEKISIRIFDISGKLIKTLYEGNVTDGKFKFYSDLSEFGLNNGLYIVKCFTENSSGFVKLMILE